MHQLKETHLGVIIPIKVVPKSNCNEIVDWENEELKVRIKELPEKGNANEGLIRFLAKTFDLSNSRVNLIAGATSRHKRVCLIGLTLNEVVSVLSLVLKTSSAPQDRNRKS